MIEFLETAWWLLPIELGILFKLIYYFKTGRKQMAIAFTVLEVISTIWIFVLCIYNLGDLVLYGSGILLIVSVFIVYEIIKRKEKNSLA